jgi:hypothetical protein
MNCKEFRKQADILFGQKEDIGSPLMKEHAASCPDCASYWNELSALDGALNELKVEVHPGELDNITFDRIARLASAPTGYSTAIKAAWSFKWILAPLTVAVAAVLIFMLAKPVQKLDNSYTGIVPYSTQEVESAILSSDTLGTELLSTLAGNDAELDRAADELIGDSDIDDILSSMSADELKAVYDKIDNLKG